MYQKILVPLDGSKQAESVLPLAGKLARIYDAELTLLHVMEYPFEMYSRCSSNAFNHPSQTDEDLQIEKNTLCREAEDYLKQLASMMEITVSKVFIAVREGPVVDAILSSVEMSKIDLIVMSPVGQDKSPWLIGATTSRILREAHVPVILISKGSHGPTVDPRALRSASVVKEAWPHPGTLSY